MSALQRLREAGALFALQAEERVERFRHPEWVQNGDPDEKFARALGAFRAEIAKVVPSVETVDREALGRLVRVVWVEWAREQPNPKPSWLKPWEELEEPDREVDRRIGERLFAYGRESAALGVSEAVENIARKSGAPYSNESIVIGGDPPRSR
jgi:hypothetical protein